MALKTIENPGGWISLEPLPTQEELDRLYTSEFYEDQKPDYLQKMKSEEFYWRKIVYSRRLEIIQKLLNINYMDDPQGSILDIGSSGGWFLEYFQDHEWRVLGLEPSPTAKRWAEQNDVVTIQGTFQGFISPYEWDVIHCSQVLEHILDPTSFLEKAKILLKPNGLLVLEIPNDFNRLQLLSDNQYWVHLHHLHYFSQSSALKLLRDCGFECLKIDASFPMEIFWLMGFDYRNNDLIGRLCHQWRMRIEESLGDRILFDTYEILAERGLGRTLTFYCKIAVE